MGVELLGMTPKQANKVISRKPKDSATLFYHIGIHRYYKEGARKNAMVFDDSIGKWGHATRSNKELLNHKSFVPISKIENLLKENKPD